VEARVAIVTGGGSGIGAATARLLAERGLRVAVAGRRAETLAETVSVIEAEGGEAFPVTADLAEPSAPRALTDEVVKRAGGLDVLVNNAASYRLTPFEQVGLEEFDDHIAVNVRAVFFLVQAALPALRRSPAPAVVNVSSAAAVMYRPGQAVYGLAKAALEHLTLQLAAELAPDGIRVNGIRPGPIRTGIHERGVPDPEERIRQLGRMVPLGRMGTPEEVAWWIAQLVDPRAEWVTGAVIPVDGGRTLGPPASV
jgi:NAD(P)-dependent dehydrogenase (short-subunit alcohol dehydrogenase family)